MSQEEIKNMQENSEVATNIDLKASDETEQVKEETVKETQQTSEPEAVQANFELDPADEIAALKEKLAIETAKNAELAKENLRYLADMDNLRKRNSKDLQNTRFNAITDTAMPFFSVFEHFKMAVKASEQSDNLKSLLQGMQMIDSEFARAFQELGIECKNVVGDEFNPIFHDAVKQEASDTVPEGHIIAQWNPCYIYGEKVLKAAAVIVSSGKAESDNDTNKPQES